MKCSHCHHKWEYKGDLKWATCPSCRLKVKVLKGGVKNGNNKDRRDC